MNAAELVTKDPRVIQLDAPVVDAVDVIDRMLEHKIGAVPVVDADHTLVGIISYVDVLRRLAPATS